MKIVIEIDDEKWVRALDGTWCGSEEITHGTPLEKVLEDIKAEINTIDSMSFGGGWASEMKSECLNVIDKHIGKENINEKNTSNY